MGGRDPADGGEPPAGKRGGYAAFPQLAGVLGGAVTPLLATLLVPQFGGFAVGLYLAFVAVVSTVASLLVHETRHADLAAEPVGAARV